MEKRRTNRYEKANQVDKLGAQGVSFIWGEQPDLAVIQPDYILISPGVPLTIPPVVYAKEHNIPVIGELELAYQNCKAPFVAITGTNGKTTTTTLTGELLKKTGKEVFVGGNIGIPLISYVEQLQAQDVVVAEVSSFQLEINRNFLSASGSDAKSNARSFRSTWRYGRIFGGEIKNICQSEII